jgi:hypothetical protein
MAGAQAVDCAMYGSKTGRGLAVGGAGSYAAATTCEFHGNHWNGISVFSGGKVRAKSVQLACNVKVLGCRVTLRKRGDPPAACMLQAAPASACEAGDWWVTMRGNVLMYNTGLATLLPFSACSSALGSAGCTMPAWHAALSISPTG